MISNVMRTALLAACTLVACKSDGHRTESHGIGFDDLLFSAHLGRVIAPAGGTGHLVLIDPVSHEAESIDGFGTASDTARARRQVSRDALTRSDLFLHAFFTRTHRTFHAQTLDAGAMVMAPEVDPEHEADGPMRSRAIALLRDRLARQIDATAQRVARPRILALGCGHLRETASSTAFSQLRIGTFAVIDPDRTALAQRATEHGNMPGLVLLGGTVRDLLSGAVAPTGFDLIYTAGLYDQLPHPVASALTAVLVKALNSKGELTVATFARKEAALRGLCSIVPRDEIASLETFVDETGCVAHLELVRS